MNETLFSTTRGEGATSAQLGLGLVVVVVVVVVLVLVLVLVLVPVDGVVDGDGDGDGSELDSRPEHAATRPIAIANAVLTALAAPRDRPNRASA